MNLEYQKLKTQIEKNREHVVAIGECGIDLYYPEEQKILYYNKEFFRMQCELARGSDLPIVIHSRNAFKETFEITQAFTDLSLFPLLEL